MTIGQLTPQARIDLDNWLETNSLYSIKCIGGQKNMSKIGEFAKGYEPIAATKNIADLSEVSTDLDLVDDEFEFTDKATYKPKVVKQKVLVLNDEKYRVPVSVIQQLKVLLEDKPELKKFKVKKSGSTKDDTRYQVIPL